MQRIGSSKRLFHCAQVAVIDTIYRKTLRVSGGDVSRMGVGGISNLQSNDISHLQWVPMNLTAMWQAPFQVSLDPKYGGVHNYRSRLAKAPQYGVVISSKGLSHARCSPGLPVCRCTGNPLCQSSVNLTPLHLPR